MKKTDVTDAALWSAAQEMSQAVFAAVLNISVSTVQKWEGGDKKPIVAESWWVAPELSHAAKQRRNG